MNYLTVLREQDSITVISATPTSSIDEARAEITQHFSRISKDYAANDHRVYSLCIGVDYYIIPACKTEIDGAGSPRISRNDWDDAKYVEIWSGTLSERIGNSTMHKAVAKLRKVKMTA